MTVYLYDFDKLEYRNPTNPHFRFRKVKPLEVRCHNLKIYENTSDDWTYEFQIVGGDGTWFSTQYHWALVVDSEENRAHIAEAERLSKERDEIMTAYNDAEHKVQTARKVHMKAKRGTDDEK